jgi:hypothetical protein
MEREKPSFCELLPQAGFTQASTDVYHGLLHTHHTSPSRSYTQSHYTLAHTHMHTLSHMRTPIKGQAPG